MKLYLCSFSIIAFYKLVSCTSKPWKRTSLVSVTTFPGLEKLFLDTTVENEPLKIEFDADIAIKRGICYYVLSSSYFKMIGEELVDPQLNETRRELNAHYVEIFKEFYGSDRPRRKRDSFFPKLRKRDYQYTNEYKERSVTVGDEAFVERVFTCLAREKKREEIKEYFVSKEYNVNKANAALWEREYITGRFIFAYNAAKQLVLHALAEDAAIFHTAYNDPEALYVARRARVGSRYLDKGSDPVCKMSEDDKLRACSAIMSIPEMKRVFKFQPKITNVELECIERELIFKSERIQKQLIRDNIVYKEWTIACVAKRREGNVLEKFFISRTYHVNKVFVYSLTSTEKISIEFIGSNVAVLDDDIKLSR